MDENQNDSNSMPYGSEDNDAANFLLSFADDDTNSDQETSVDSPHVEKRRKIDEDGFVTPATPDIPKTSIQYSRDRHNRSNDSDNASSSPPKYQADEEDEEECNLYYQTLNDEDDSVPGDKEEASSPCSDHGAGGDGPEVIRIPDDDNKEEQQSITALLTRLAEDAKEVSMSWEQPLSESEQYETSCLQQLEHIMEKAREHEENLILQKEKLRQRLQALSRTLQLL